MTTLQIARCQALRRVRRDVLAQAERHEGYAKEAEGRGDYALARNERMIAQTCRDSAARYLAELHTINEPAPIEAAPLFAAQQVA